MRAEITPAEARAIHLARKVAKAAKVTTSPHSFNRAAFYSNEREAPEPPGRCQ